MFSRRRRVKPSWQSAPYRPGAWGTALLFAVCLAVQAHANHQPCVIQTVAVDGTTRPLQLETKAGELLERSRAARDVKRLWATGWFDDIRVESEAVPEGCVVRFQLTERTRYLLRRVRFKPRNFELPNLVPSGDLIDRAVVKRLAGTFEEKLKDLGYREATVHFELTPIGIRQADVVFRVNHGRRTLVDRVEVSSLNHEDSRQAAGILHGIQPRRLLPGIPRVWKGWKLRAAMNQETLNLALWSLRAHYISQGYLDATAMVERIGFEESLASISVRVLPGTRYRIESLQIADSLTARRPEILQSPQLTLKDLCHCLLKKRAQAERSGISDFEAHLVVHPAYQNGEPGAQQRVSLSAQIQMGFPNRVRSITFRGNHHLSDLTLRKVLVLSEGEWFDRSLLRRSLIRLNLTGLIHPLSELDVEVQPDSVQHEVDLVISVRETDSGRWFLGAPVRGGLSRGAFSVGSRLPNWGPSYLELPTHFVAFNLTGPVFGLPLSAFNPAHFSITLARPYFPGQSWRSGFQVSPQTSWPQMLLASGTHQARPRLAEWLQPPPGLSVPVRWNAASSDQPSALTSGVLNCVPESKLQGRLLSYLQIATEWLLPATF